MGTIEGVWEVGWCGYVVEKRERERWRGREREREREIRSV